MKLAEIIQLQNLLHNLLSLYLNGARLKGKVGIELTNNVNRFISQKYIWNRNSVKIILSEGYKILQDEINRFDKSSRKLNLHFLQSFKTWKEKVKDNDILEPILNMAADIEKHTDLFLFAGFHGSLSTFDYEKNFSDLDTIFVFKKDVLYNPKLLLEAKKAISKLVKYLYQICILQHHFHFIITEIDLDFYPNNYFPSVLFNHTTQIVGR